MSCSSTPHLLLLLLVTHHSGASVPTCAGRQLGGILQGSHCVRQLLWLSLCCYKSWVIKVHFLSHLLHWRLHAVDSSLCIWKVYRSIAARTGEDKLRTRTQV